MPEVIIQYGKGGPLRYLSHLELIRALERSFRRAKIDIQVSGGFNPRPKISYGPALSVGVGSRAEYMVINLKAPVSEKELLEKISFSLPKGLNIYRAKYIAEKSASIMSVVKSAAYHVRVDISPSNTDIGLIIDQLRQQERLLVKHKEKEKWVETSRAILDWQVERRIEGDHDFSLLLSMGDHDSIRPEIAISKLSEISPDLDSVEIVEICRTEQYVNRVSPLITIYDFYEGVNMRSECF